MYPSNIDDALNTLACAFPQTVGGADAINMIMALIDQAGYGIATQNMIHSILTDADDAVEKARAMVRPAR